MTDGNDHPILTAVGLVAVALGLLMAFVPSFAGAIGTGYVAVTAVGLLALVQAIRVASARRATELEATETPDVETVESVAAPGAEFDRTVAQLHSGSRRVFLRDRSDLRETLEAAALTAVADRENCSREQARERVEAGTWTDDLYAASFLGGDDAPSPPIVDRMKIAISSESPDQKRIRRTASEVARAAGVEPADGDGRPDAGDATGGGPGGFLLGRLSALTGGTSAPDADGTDGPGSDGASGSGSDGTSDDPTDGDDPDGDSNVAAGETSGGTSAATADQSGDGDRTEARA